jgi:hypothetical protein
MVEKLTSPSPVPKHPDSNFSAQEVQRTCCKLLITACEKIRSLPGIMSMVNPTLHPNVAVDKNNV